MIASALKHLFLAIRFSFALRQECVILLGKNMQWPRRIGSPDSFYRGRERIGNSDPRAKYYRPRHAMQYGYFHTEWMMFSALDGLTEGRSGPNSPWRRG